MILSGIGDDIYSIVDACTTAKEMLIAIERLQQDLDKESYHKLFDIIKHYQNEANEIRAEKLVRNANPLACVAATQHYPDTSKGKEIDKAITPASEEDEDNDPKQAQRDKDMQKNLALIECGKPKRAKDYAYHKENMMLCKQEDKGVPLSAEQGDWLNDTDEEPDEHELEAHYIQHSKQPETINDKYVVEMVDNDRVVLANLIANLKLDHDENKKILKQLKKANASLTHELNECKSALEESNDIRDRCRSALHDQEIELKKYKKYKNCQVEKEEVEHKLKDTLGLIAQQKI
ncbi:hypothetical protein Tco_1026890 [Tanacetum coccineum]